MTSEQRILYVRSILETFARHHKLRRAPSNADYHLACKWAERRVPVGPLGDHQFVTIPLATILQGIVETPAGKAKALAYCEASVEENIRRWAQSYGGLTTLPSPGPLEDVPL